jgi:hypothetical protein
MSNYPASLRRLRVTYVAMPFTPYEVTFHLKIRKKPSQGSASLSSNYWP